MRKLLLFLILSCSFAFSQITVGGNAKIGGAVTMGASSGSASPATNIGTGVFSFLAINNITTTGTATAGGRIVVGIATNTICSNGTSGFTGVTDSGSGGSNTYSQDLLLTGTSTKFFCFYSAHVSHTVSSGGTVTIACAVTSNCTFEAWAIYLTATGGVDSGTPNAAHNAFSGTITATAGGAVSGSDTCLAWFQGAATTSDGFGSPSNSFTGLFTTVVGNYGNVLMAYKSVSSGTPSSAVTTTNDEWGSGMVCYVN